MTGGVITGDNILQVAHVFAFQTHVARLKSYARLCRGIIEINSTFSGVSITEHILHQAVGTYTESTGMKIPRSSRRVFDQPNIETKPGGFESLISH